MASRDTRITPKALDKTACINSPKQTQTHTYAHTAVICKCNWLRHVPLHHTLLIVLVFLSFKSQTCIDSFKTLTFLFGRKAERNHLFYCRNWVFLCKCEICWRKMDTCQFSSPLPCCISITNSSYQQS